LAAAAGYDELTSAALGTATAYDVLSSATTGANRGIDELGVGVDQVKGKFRDFRDLAGETATKADLVAEATGAAGDKFGLFGELVGDAADDLDEFHGVAGSTIDTMTLAQEAFNAAAQAAGNFGDELARLTGNAISVADAEADVWEWALKFTDALATQDDELGHVNRSLAINTLEGLSNIDMFAEQRDNILKLAQARLDDGEAIETVAADVLYNTGVMEDNAVAAGFNRAEFDLLLASWGLTPEMVKTAIVQGGMLTAQQRLTDLLAKYDDIPPKVATQIQAFIDMGQYDKAEAALDQLDASRVAPILAILDDYRAWQRIYALTATKTVAFRAITLFAEGGYIGSPVHNATIGEAGPEVVLPLTNPSRMASLLDDPRVSGPVMAALGNLTAASSSGGGGGGGAVVQNITLQMINPNGDDILRKLQQLQRQRGPLPLRVA
jgi:hypothetical protein